jgi:hypothetical protein
LPDNVVRSQQLARFGNQDPLAAVNTVPPASTCPG